MNSSSSRREKAGASRLFSWLLCPALVLAIAMGLGLLPPAALWTLLGLPLLRAFELVDQRDPVADNQGAGATGLEPDVDET
ncbi:hypothetical protein ACSFA0_24685 [Variovorax sp. LT1P1]